MCKFMFFSRHGQIGQGATVCSLAVCVVHGSMRVQRRGGSLGPCLERESDALAPAPALLPAVQRAEAVECDEWNGEAQQRDGWSVPAGNEHDAQRGP